MMTRALRRSLERQEGQALVLACVLMLILSIALITTVNIGHGVHERIRLQNTADAAAYSTAAMEARAFNFYAFTNRTQVSHYVSAMLWQSLDSFIFFVQAFLTDVFGLMRTIGPCFPKDSRSGVWKLICAVLDKLPYIGIIMKALDTIYTILRGMLLLMKGVLEPIDEIIGTVVVPGHRTLNSVMAGAATAVMISTSSYVFGTSNAIIKENDPNVDSLIPQTVAGLINQCLYNRTHYKEANGTPLSPVNPFDPLDPTKRDETDKVARAKRVMAGITNATRFPCDSKTGICPETMVTDRRLGSLMPIPNWLKPLESVLNDFPKWGQTRFLTYRLGFGGMEATKGDASKRRNKIREANDLPNLPMGMLGQGDVLGADDPYYIKLPGPSQIDIGIANINNPFRCPKTPDSDDGRTWRDCWGDPREEKNDTLKTSIWAMSRTDLRENGIHWRVVFPGQARTQDDRNVGLYESRPCLAKVLGKCVFDDMSIFVANVRIDPDDDNHPWEGLAPFPHFEPGDYAKDCVGGAGDDASTTAMAERKDDFNQPSTWVMLNKDTQQLHNKKPDATGATYSGPGRLNSSGKLKFSFGQSPTTLELDNDRKKISVAGWDLVTGMNVISRGQTYYHRPGNWTEQPNFFNPYWRPRLAAVWQGKDQLPLVNKLADALPNAIKDSPAKIITH
ncbi:pilus assembly protein TadG-related protein [Archangium lipolyticum]|uniref:pilus assembly protein TadG-related protein n=1 Tax=Archangium lipolyticum TaxID=2970465 RepID=UPI002149EDCF|nr:pilus assembly protein TadG-related protein [Archangium lipolyticum]